MKRQTRNTKREPGCRRTTFRFAFRISCFAFLLPFALAADDPYQQALAPRDWSFPRDQGRHDGFRIEWWYFTGNLAGDAGRRLGYQLTFFRTLMSPEKTP